MSGLEPKEYLERKTLDRLDAPDPSNKDLADALKMIYGRLWSKDELTALIVQTHHALCSKCDKVQTCRTVGGVDVKWACGIISTLVGAVCAALAYFIKT